ncbi:hypothetical protein ACNKHT_21175 [Shigella flexneri]
MLVAQYQLMQLCIKHGDGEVVDKAWATRVRRTTALQGMRSNLNIESPAGHGPITFKSNQYAIADADYPILRNLSYSEYAAELITDTFREFFDTPVRTAQDVHKQLKRLRRAIAWTGKRKRLSPFIAGSRRQRVIGFKRGAISNTKINATEEEILQGEPEIKVESAERHHAMVNFWRTTLSCILGHAFLAVDGLDFRSGAMVMIAV